MRTTINHIPPARPAMQPKPGDITRENVMYQVDTATNGYNIDVFDGRPLFDKPIIHTQSAMEIAAWWQSPGTEGAGMAQFASTGTITDALFEDIDRETRRIKERDPRAGIYVTDDGTGGWVTGDLGSVEDNLAALAALAAYVRACRVTVWTVIHYDTGSHEPQTEESLFLAYTDAMDHYLCELDDAPDALCGPECECTVDNDEVCDLCAIRVEIGAYRRDGMRPGEVDQTIVLRPDSAVTPTVYQLTRTAMSVSAYLAGKTG